MNFDKLGSFECSDGLDRFQKTVDLISRNKVNKSNAFENRLVDEVDEMFRRVKGGGDRNGDRSWTYFSVVVEACGKIYGYCVDYLHDETFKILGGVNRTVDSELSTQDRPPTVQKKCQVHGQGTLETCEGLLMVKDLENLVFEDTSFRLIRNSFDLTEFSTLILNKVSTNPSLDLVVAAEDLVIEEESTPQTAEVNLEGIIEFSVCQLLDYEISGGIEKIDKLQNCPTETLTFNSVWEKINEEHVNIEPIDNISEQEDELEEEEKENEVEEFGFREQLCIEDRIMQDFPLDFIQSSKKIIFSKDFLASGVTKKAKKRKRKEAFKEEDINRPICKLKIEDFVEEEKFLTVEERKKPLEGGKAEKGYRESRLCELFTRSGQMMRTSYGGEVNETEYEPLSVDPSIKLLSEKQELKIEGKLELNIRALKDCMKKVIEVNQRGDFSTIFDAVEKDLKKNNIDQISVPTCFVTLLHLANEHSLSLQPEGENNFFINSFSHS